MRKYAIDKVSLHSHFSHLADKGEMSLAYGLHVPSTCGSSALRNSWENHCIGFQDCMSGFIHITQGGYIVHLGGKKIWPNSFVGVRPYPTLHLEVHSHRDRSWVQKEVFGRSTSMTYVISPYITKTCIYTQHVQYVRAWVRNATMSKHNLKVHRFVVCQTFCFFFGPP